MDADPPLTNPENFHAPLRVKRFDFLTFFRYNIASKFKAYNVFKFLDFVLKI